MTDGETRHIIGREGTSETASEMAKFLTQEGEMRTRLISVAAALVAVFVSTGSAAASAERFNPPKSYYLALGDSVAFGFQQAKFFGELTTGTYTPASFNTGYVDDFAAHLATIRPGIQTVNYGCPGETTLSFITGPCVYQAGGFALHASYGGSQQAAALAFLHAHPGQVSPITLDNGANDITPCQGSTDPTCFPRALSQIGTDLNQTLAKLRAAAPGGEIIVMQYYNPFFVVDPNTDPVAIALDRVIAQAAAAHGARLADAFAPINGAFVGNPAAEAASVCANTGMCVPPPGGDIHPSDAGYSLIAGQFWQASGYSRLGD